MEPEDIERHARAIVHALKSKGCDDLVATTVCARATAIFLMAQGLPDELLMPRLRALTADEVMVLVQRSHAGE